MDGLLAGRVAVITGGARGIGGAIVERLAEHGATGLVLDAEAVIAAAKLPEGFAGRGGDVTKEAQLAAVMAEAGKTFGRIDVLVANAGIVPPWHETSDLDFDEWDRVFAVNARGIAAAMKHATPSRA